MRYVGVTGFTSRQEIDFALSALPKDLTLMCGVLVSEKTLQGQKNRWHLRYPQTESIKDIFSPDPRCLNLIHYCSSCPPAPETIGKLRDLGGPNLHGYQFNGTWPSPNTIYTEIEEYKHTVVLQSRSFSTIENNLVDILKVVYHSRIHVLLDCSGGRGKDLDLFFITNVVKKFNSCFGSSVGLGISGGLCSETLPQFIDLIKEYNLNIDAEGKLRDGADGGILNFDKLTAYLQTASLLN